MAIFEKKRPLGRAVAAHHIYYVTRRSSELVRHVWGYVWTPQDTNTHFSFGRERPDLPIWCNGSKKK